MDPRRYWRAIKRRVWIPIILAVATTLTVGALTYFSKPEYVATATVQARVTSSNSSPAPTQTLSLQEVVASHKLALAVINDLKLDLSPSELSQRLQVTAGHSDLFTIAFRDPDANRAVAVTDSAAQQAVRIYQEENAVSNTTVFEADVSAERTAFLQRFQAASRALLQFEADNPDVAHSSDIGLQTQYQELVLDQQAAASAYQSFVASSTNSVVTAMSEATHFTANVVDPAVAGPDWTSRYLKVGYAGVVALVLGFVLILILEYSDNAIREPDSVEQLIGLPVVGVIPLATPQTLRKIRGASA